MYFFDDLFIKNSVLASTVACSTSHFYKLKIKIKIIKILFLTIFPSKPVHEKSKSQVFDLSTRYSFLVNLFCRPNNIYMKMKINFEKSKQIPFNCNSDFNFSVYAEPFKPTSLDAIYHFFIFPNKSVPVLPPNLKTRHI